MGRTVDGTVWSILKKKKILITILKEINLIQRRKQRIDRILKKIIFEAKAFKAKKLIQRGKQYMDWIWKEKKPDSIAQPNESEILGDYLIEFEAPSG